MTSWKSCLALANYVCSGIDTAPARTNDIEPRIGSVRYFLNTMIDGQPAFVLSKEGCPELRRGFLKNYCYKRISVGGEERYKEVPHKNMSSHPHDALQYICLEFAADRIIKDKAPVNKVDMWNPVLRIF